MQIAECYRYLGKYQEAINSYKTCFQHGPDRAMLSEQCTKCLVQAAQITAYLGLLRANLSSFWRRKYMLLRMESGTQRSSILGPSVAASYKKYFRR